LGTRSRKGRLNNDPAQLARVRGIAQRLIAQATVFFRADAAAWRWESNVLTWKEIDVWRMPGEKIAVYTGLIDRVQPTEDELAAAMGYEIADALREHGRERAARAARYVVGVP
jgi:Zn-dependent protease with chaperone function